MELARHKMLIRAYSNALVLVENITEKKNMEYDTISIKNFLLIS